ncbi:DUF5916 domain-containing protein [Geojedonia litorea]|uniref:DUF5916 domain-containing protein n=1 Tax=Geojedonia litorea TaxID=1268269 RepID=A0ABV9N3D3_9FLAO
MTARLLYFLIYFIAFHTVFAQEKKTLNINKTTEAPKIDGVLDDEVWQNAEEATDFIQFRPEMGVIETEDQRTIVKMAYDDNAIYVAAYLYDSPELIMKQVNQRDNFGQQDFFTVVLNPNNDAQNDTEFFAFPSGNQADAIVSPGNGNDFGWNGVWDSTVKIVEDGWIVEMKIPYSNLRFSNQAIQTWGIQFHRRFRRDNTQYSWNPIDRTKGNTGLYHGVLQGIENIKPPTRLSLYPFASGLFTTIDGKSENKQSLGLDLKYGVTENFTIDATLIPDFSQAGFDDVRLNLGPFEQMFSEQRQFFTEGVDLFNKGNLFYSRRVGGSPAERPQLNENEEFVNYPNTIKVLNAVKLSGRTKKGLGVGIFNSITEKTEVTIKNTDTDELRKAIAEPFTNYNIIVLDQQFNKNSSVSLINTNVTRNGHYRDANVTGLLADITNKKNTFNLEAEVKMSSLNLADGNQNGYSTEFEISKVGGNFRYGIGHDLADNKYDINDLGVQFRNNYSNYSADFSYRTFEPTENFNSLSIGIRTQYRQLFKPSTYTGFNIGINFDAQSKKLHNFGINFNTEPGKQYDYFGPRTEGRYFIYENAASLNGFFSSNSNKVVSFFSRVSFYTQFESDRDLFSYSFDFGPRIRFNDHFSLRYSIDFNRTGGSRGYVTDFNADIIYGERDQVTLVNSIRGSYNFNSYHGLSLSFRNYWATVDYDEDLFHLLENGKLSREKGYTVNDIADPNINFNTWNLDFSYTWQFAPGSQLSALYRNQLFNYSNAASDDYFDSLETLFEQPIQHTLSLRLVYFIDYNNVKHLFMNNEG